MLLASFLQALTHIFAESAPYLLFGFAAAGLFRALVPEQQVYRLLGENRFRSVFLASLFGVPLPLCSCSVIPAATALHESGASRAATTSFLISTPETGVDSISITYALMDPLMTIARPIAAFATALATGSAVALLPADTTTPPVPPTATSSCCADDGCGNAEDAPRSRRAEIAAGLRYSFGPLLDDLAPWLIIGFVLAALIGALVPDGVIGDIPQGWVSSLLMMLIATPVYICATAATPVAAALILKGLDPGAALVFLLVGPATNITTMLVVFRFLGGRVLSVYLAGVTVAALLFGMALNAAYTRLDIDITTTVTAPESHAVSTVQMVAMAILIALFGYRLGRKYLPLR